MLGVDDVVVRFDGDAVLAGASLHVASGEIVALLGPSGSGKSTLLRVIAGLLTPDSGRVRLDGVDVTETATHRRSVGMVFQDEQLFPHLSVADNVAFGLRMSGVSKTERRQRADALLTGVGLVGFGDRAVGELSGGEAKRVAVIRSLAPSPSILLLDEPLTGLDADLHDQLADEVSATIRASATTTVWVTHDRDEADAVADRIVTIDELHEG